MEEGGLRALERAKTSKNPHGVHWTQRGRGAERQGAGHMAGDKRPGDEAPGVRMTSPLSMRAPSTAGAWKAESVASA